MHTSCFGTDLFRLSLGPVVLPLFTYKHTVLGSVDQCVKWHKAHDAGQTETAWINLHSNLNSDRWHIYIYDLYSIQYIWILCHSNYEGINVFCKILPGNLCIGLCIWHRHGYQLYPERSHQRVHCLRSLDEPEGWREWYQIHKHYVYIIHMDRWYWY